MPKEPHAPHASQGRTSRVIDHQLARRRVLKRIRAGEVHPAQARTATASLLSSAEVLGTSTDRACPLCGADGLRETLWVHGTSLGEKSGTARSVREIDGVLGAYPGISIHTVEVCMTCRWNFLIREEITGSDSARDDQPGDSFS